MLLALVSALAATVPGDGLRPEKVFVADVRKSRFYVKDGLVVGGDEAIDDVVVLDVRHSNNPGYERVVIDLEGNKGGESAAIARPPYFHVEVTPSMRRLVLTMFGKPKLAFDPKKVLHSFRSSRVVERVQLFPILEKDRWTMALNLKYDAPVEVFELKSPTRLILDLSTGKK